jgi:hypothetical protein
MAQFKEVTLNSGEKVMININEIRFIQRVSPEETMISFAKDHGLNVKETPNEILTDQPDRRL